MVGTSWIFPFWPLGWPRKGKQRLQSVDWTWVETMNIFKNPFEERKNSFFDSRHVIIQIAIVLYLLFIYCLNVQFRTYCYFLIRFVSQRLCSLIHTLITFIGSDVSECLVWRNVIQNWNCGVYVIVLI